jgi:DNA-binding MarR family transcriptional regulator
MTSDRALVRGGRQAGAITGNGRTSQSSRADRSDNTVGARSAPADVIAEAERQWLAHWGPDAVPAMVAVTSIMRVHQILLARLNELLAPWGLTFARYEALMLLYYSRRGALPLGRLGSRLQVHPTSVTNTIDGLERLGLVSRERHERDRRMTLASITAVGRAAARGATAVLNEAHFACSPLSARELELVATTLRGVRIDEGDFVDG